MSVFISYRRADSIADARQLRDEFARRIGPSNVFFDVASLESGMHWKSEIDKALEKSHLLLCLIGHRWVASFAERSPDTDVVLHELVTGLRLSPKIRIIPVLVGGADSSQLASAPRELAGIAQIQAQRLSYEYYDADLKGLLVAASAVIPVLRSGNATSEACLSP
jgi:hypothetical protein